MSNANSMKYQLLLGDPGNNIILNSDMISVINASSNLYQYIHILICHNFKARCKIQSI